MVVGTEGGIYVFSIEKQSSLPWHEESLPKMIEYWGD